MQDNDIDDFGLNWRSIEKPYIEISNPEKFLEMLESAGIETYENHNIKINNIEKNEIKKFFLLKENKNMTVKELKKITENLDDETQVFVTFADETKEKVFSEKEIASIISNHYPITEEDCVILLKNILEGYMLPGSISLQDKTIRLFKLERGIKKAISLMLCGETEAAERVLTRVLVEYK